MSDESKRYTILKNHSFTTTLSSRPWKERNDVIDRSAFIFAPIVARNAALSDA